MRWSRRHFAWLAAVFISHPSAEACDGPVNSVYSPDRKIEALVCVRAGQPVYAVKVEGREVIAWSALGFVLKNEPALDSNFRQSSIGFGRKNERWEQVWGEERYIRDNHNEMRVGFEEAGGLNRRMTVVFRAYDDGIGFRYFVPEQPALRDFVIMDELTEFNFTSDHTAWWIPAYVDSSYEMLYKRDRVSALPAVHTPLTLESDGLYFSIHEANLTDYSSMQLVSTGGGRLKADLAPWADGDRVKTRTPMLTPWRTIQIARRPGDLITSYLVLNLNEPNKLVGRTFARPQKYIGIWWGMHIGTMTWGPGDKHGATTRRAKEYIDFASAAGFPSVLVEGWNFGWEGDWTKERDFDFLRPYPDFDLKAVTDYAASKGVSLVGHHETAGGISNYERQADQAFKLYREHGVGVVKTGYVAYKVEGDEWHYGQSMVRHYQLITEKAAAHGIALDVHEPVKDTGLRRTYPNMMTREGGRGTEYEAWGGPVGNPPSHTTIIPFTRGLSGPFDFTPGIFNVLAGSRAGIDRVRTTLAKQLAYYVVIYSPLHMAADLPENYAGHLAFKFIQDVPVDWHTTRVLNAEIGGYLTTVRRDRNSEDWYLGSITNESPREFDIALDFLDPRKTYCAEIYQDRSDAHWESNPTSYEIKAKTVTSTDRLQVKLAPGGGQAVRFAAGGDCALRYLGR